MNIHSHEWTSIFFTFAINIQLAPFQNFPTSFVQGGPLQVISGNLCGPYKWPYKHMGFTGVKIHPTYRGYLTPFVTGDGAHLVHPPIT